MWKTIIVFVVLSERGLGAANDSPGSVGHQHEHSLDGGLAVGSVDVVGAGLPLDVETVDHQDGGGHHISEVLKTNMWGKN